MQELGKPGQRHAAKAGSGIYQIEDWTDTVQGAKREGVGRKGLRPFFLRGCGAPTRRPPHPGDFLRTRYMVPLGISQQQLARELGISRRRINELVKGHRGITPDTAIRLAAYFGTDAGFWMVLQNAWDMHLAWKGFAFSQRRPSVT